MPSKKNKRASNATNNNIKTKNDEQNVDENTTVPTATTNNNDNEEPTTTEIAPTSDATENTPLTLTGSKTQNSPDKADKSNNSTNAPSIEAPAATVTTENEFDDVDSHPPPSGLCSPTTILVNSKYNKYRGGGGYGSIDPVAEGSRGSHSDFGDSQKSKVLEMSSTIVEEYCMRERIENETQGEAIREFLHLFLVNAATWGIWNTLDLAVLLTMAAFLASGDVFAGVATAMTITSLTALSVSNGMSSALETLISNAHGADRFSPLIPRYLRASLLVNVSLFAPMALLFVLIPYSWLEVIFPHGNPLMLGGMQTWLRMSPFVIMPQILSACLQKYVVCQRRPEVVTRSASLSVVILPFLLYIATRHASPFAFAVAIAIDKTVLLVAMLVNIVWDGHLRGNLYIHSKYGSEDGEVEEGSRDAYACDGDNELVPLASPKTSPSTNNNGNGSSSGYFSASSANSAANRAIAALPFWYYVKLYVKTGYPSAIAFCIDTWTFELMTILSARCGPTEAAAWVLMQQLTHPIFATANGLASAAATDVGNAFGAECRPTTVFKKVRIAAGTSVIVGMLGGLLLFFFGPKVFPFMIHNSHESSADELKGLKGEEAQYSAQEAMAIGAHNIPIFALQVAFDIPFYTLQGIYRGLNKQAMSAKIVFVALWMIAVPVAFSWPAGWGGCVRGIVTALLFGSSTGAISLYVYIVRHIEMLVKRHFDSAV